MAIADDRSSRAGGDEARIPCPVCAQPVHPIAGRCKHCKTDLVKLREQRGQRAARIDLAAIGIPTGAGAPPFAPVAPAAAATSPYAPSTTPPMTAGDVAFGQTPEATLLDHPPMTPPTALPIARTDGGGTYVTEKRGWSRRWPLIVTLVAGVAILVCAYLLLFSSDGEAKAAGSTRKAGGALPAPDRMDTMPDTAPMPIPMVPDRQQTAPRDPDPDPDPADPWADPTPPTNPNPTPRNAAVPPAEEFTAEALRTLCTTLKACGMDLGGGGIDICNLMDGLADMQRSQVKSGRCTYDEKKAASCLQSLGSVKCTGGLDLDALAQGFDGFGDCGTALVCR